MNERVFADAERRLGRKLTESERRIDILGYDRDLEEGKRLLYLAIEKEKSRVIKATARGRNQRLRVTPEMVDALTFLHERGRAHAHAELRAAGIEPEREYASPRQMRLNVGEAGRRRPSTSALAGLLKLLQSKLGRLSRRVRSDWKIRVGGRGKKVDVDLTPAVQRALVNAMERKVPGALGIAADIVSGAMAAGLAEGFEKQADLFPCWIYSAVMDGGTCVNCRKLDGKRFPTWAAIMAVLPNGGPNPLCLGNGRCRCRPVPCPIGRLFLPEETGVLLPEEPEGRAPSEVIAFYTRGPDRFSWKQTHGGGVLAEGKRKEEVKRGIRILDATFRVPLDAPVIQIEKHEPYASIHTGGSFVRSFETGPKAILINDRSDIEGAYTIFHEFGHYLDSLAGHIARPSDSTSSPWEYISHRLGSRPQITPEVRDALARVVAAINDSPSYRELLQKTRDSHYFASSHEKFARAVCQWLILRSGDREALDYLRERGRELRRDIGYSDQWEIDEFGPIYDALEAYFHVLGWLRD